MKNRINLGIKQNAIGVFTDNLRVRKHEVIGCKLDLLAVAVTFFVSEISNDVLCIKWIALDDLGIDHISIILQNAPISLSKYRRVEGWIQIAVVTINRLLAIINVFIVENHSGITTKLVNGMTKLVHGLDAVGIRLVTRGHDDKRLHQIMPWFKKSCALFFASA